MVSDNFQNVLATAGACASRLGHSEVTVTHVTYVLCTTGALTPIFAKLGMDAKAFENTILDALASDECFKIGGGADLRASQALSTCIARAEDSARKSGRSEFSHDDFLLEALERDHGSEGDDFARVTFYSFNNRQAPSSPATVMPMESDGGQRQEAVAHGMEQFSGVGASESPSALALWAVDLVASASRGELDEVFGRDDEIGRVCNILRRRRKNNPVLIGEPGVGKTAVVEGLAVMIARGTAPDFLLGRRIYALDLGRILAGTRNRGDLEERFKSVLDAVAESADVILFIDEIHTLLGNGGAMAGVPDLLKPALAGGRMRCIGATTFDEFSRYFSADPAMVRRFQEVAVPEPGRDDAIDIVRKTSEVYARHHGVRFTDEAIIAAVDLSIRHLVGRHLPDKAIDILDEAAAATRAGSVREVTPEVILQVVREMSRDRFIGNADDAFWHDLSHRMRSQVQGRGQVIRELSEFLRGVSSHPVARTGAKASFFFQGAEGSGKRHVAESLASALGIPFIPIEMGAYGERSSVSALIGAPPGYVGYDDGGKLTEAVRRHPVSVILFDKIDKASQPVRDIVSSAISSGHISDSRGRKVNFRNAIIIVTQDSEMASRSIGFRTNPATDAAQGVAGMSFDRMFTFDAVSDEAAAEIVSRRLDCVASSYAASGNSMTVDGSAVAAITERGRSSGGRAGDYMTAFTEMFEAELFRVTLPRNGALRVTGANGRIVVELEKSDGIAA